MNQDAHCTTLLGGYRACGCPERTKPARNGEQETGNCCQKEGRQPNIQPEGPCSQPERLKGSSPTAPVPSRGAVG